MIKIINRFAGNVVVSRHRSPEAADRAMDKLCKQLPKQKYPHTAINPYEIKKPDA